MSCPVQVGTGGTFQYNLIISVVCVFFWMTALLVTGRWAFLPLILVIAASATVLGIDYSKRKDGSLDECDEGYYFGVMLLPLWLSIALFIVLVVLKQAQKLEMLHAIADRYMGVRTRRGRK